MKLMRVPPSRSSSASCVPRSGCSIGARTLMTMSDCSHRAAVPSITSAPALRYDSSSKLAAAPAPLSTTTEKPIFTSLLTLAGEAATRHSPGQTSRGTPIFIDGISLFLCPATTSAAVSVSQPMMRVLASRMKRFWRIPRWMPPSLDTWIGYNGGSVTSDPSPGSPQAKETFPCSLPREVRFFNPLPCWYS